MISAAAQKEHHFLRKNQAAYIRPLLKQIKHILYVVNNEWTYGSLEGGDRVVCNCLRRLYKRRRRRTVSDVLVGSSSLAYDVSSDEHWASNEHRQPGHQRQTTRQHPTTHHEPTPPTIWPPNNQWRTENMCSRIDLMTRAPDPPTLYLVTPWVVL